MITTKMTERSCLVEIGAALAFLTSRATTHKMASLRFEVIQHGSDLYRAAIVLRDDLLRNPMGLVTGPEEMFAEKDLIHVAGFLEDELCATCLLVLEGESMRMKRVAVSASSQSQGIGTAMLRFCEDLARREGATEVYAHARETAVRFYEKAGYQTQGDYFEEAGIPHIVARKQL